MTVIGLCGSSGSGKGYACQIFSLRNVAYIDTDRVYREEVLSDPLCINELTGFFGNCILENGAVSKKRLATLVFEGKDSEKRLARLNEITHKYIKVKTLELISDFEKQGYAAVLVDAPVLFESGFDKICDVTVCVTAPIETKIERIMKRDSITREKAIARLSSQLDDRDLRARCTYEIDNSGTQDVTGQIISILKDLRIE